MACTTQHLAPLAPPMGRDLRGTAGDGPPKFEVGTRDGPCLCSSNIWKTLYSPPNILKNYILVLYHSSACEGSSVSALPAGKVRFNDEMTKKRVIRNFWWKF